MFGTSYTFLIFLFLGSSSSWKQYRRHAKNGSHPASRFHLRNVLQRPHQDFQGGNNIQKLVYSKDLINNAYDDQKTFRPGSVLHPGKPRDENNIIQNVNPFNVHLVREMVAHQWPLGKIPYYVNKEIYDHTTTKRIVSAMKVIESASCVKFKELKDEPEDSRSGWLHITNPNNMRECVHSFATVGTETRVILGFDCFQVEQIVHSLLHALGFQDEVTHPQRDKYIRILWENIKPEYRPLFRIRYDDPSQKLVEYDRRSIMHFHMRAFSENGAPTIAPIGQGLQISYTTTLSQLDIMRLKLAFDHECNRRNIGRLLNACKNSMIPTQPTVPTDPEYNVNENGCKEINFDGDNKLKPLVISMHSKALNHVQYITLATGLVLFKMRFAVEGEHVIIDLKSSLGTSDIVIDMSSDEITIYCNEDETICKRKSNSGVLTATTFTPFYIIIKNETLRIGKESGGKPLITYKDHTLKSAEYFAFTASEYCRILFDCPSKAFMDYVTELPGNVTDVTEDVTETTRETRAYDDLGNYPG